MMDILSSFIINPSDHPSSLGLLNPFSGLPLTEGFGRFSFPLLTVTPFGGNFLGSSSEVFFEIFRTGLFHGVFFSLPFSIPMLICFRRYILDGISLGNYAFAGTLLGHLSFLFCTIKGIRPIIQFWYPLEPLLSLLGLGLSLKIATDFFSQRRFVFDGILGSSEDSSAYAMNPWPKLPELSWLFPREFASKIPPSFLPVILIPKTIFLVVLSALQSTLRSKLFEPIRLPFQKFENFCQKNLGPSIFTFQFFLMWLNPASASTLNLVFFEQDILQGVFLSPNAPIFLLYTLGFIFASGVLSSLILFLIFQLSGRNFLGLFLKGNLGSVGVGFGKSEFSGQSTWFQRASRMIQFDEALAQNRFKIFNKFFAFLIIGCVVQGGLNYTWRLFLQYPLEMIHWDFFTTLTKKFSIFDRSTKEPTAASMVLADSPQTFPKTLVETPLKEAEINSFNELFQNQLSQNYQEIEAMDTEISSLMAEIYKVTLVEMSEPNRSGPAVSDQLTEKLNTLLAKKKAYLRKFEAGLKNSRSDEKSRMLTNKLNVQTSRELGLRLPISTADDMKLASSFFMSSPNEAKRDPAQNFSKESNFKNDLTVHKKNPVSLETYWTSVTTNKDFSDSNPSGLIPQNSNEPLPSFGSGETPINFFGRREFPPYDTSIRNREKNLPVERHLAIERVNARRGLMGRPPLENEERENAIFKYHTFFMNQIDRATEDFKMKLVTPGDLYREENDILALQKLHENFLKQKGRESEYKNSVINPIRGTRAGIANPKNSLPRHPRDFFTKSRPITNTTKGFSKSSYIRDLFDPNLQGAYSAYSHDDLLLEKIITNSTLDKK